MVLTIDLTQRDRATPVINRLVHALRPQRPLNAALGKSLELVLHRHFRRRDSEPNKRGWPKQHFWARIRRVTALSSISEDGATVTVSDPAFGARVHGATIRPKQARALAIPLVPQAAGVRPSSGLIQDLFMLRAKDGRGFLAREEGQGLTLYYRLVKRVTHPKDPRALPSRAAILSALERTATSFLRRRAPDRS